MSWDKFWVDIANHIDSNMINNCLKSTEELHRLNEEYENRKCFCILTDNSLACARRITGEIFEVVNYDMTDEPITNVRMKRWATGFDV